MKDNDKQLGDMDLFGLDGFGPDSWMVVLGGAAGAAGQAVGSMVARKYGEPGGFLANNHNLVGAGAGALIGAGLVFAGQKDAGWAAIGASAISGLVRFAAAKMDPTLDGVVMDPTVAFQGYGGGFGLVDMEPTTAFQGADGMPQLVGASLAAASDHVQLMGGPALSGPSGHWGSHHFNMR